MPFPKPSPAWQGVFLHLGAAWGMLAVALLSGLAALFCWQWHLPTVTWLEAVLGVSGCVWLVASLAAHAQERHSGHIAAALAASSPTLLTLACQGATSVSLTVIALLVGLLAARIRWSARPLLSLPLLLAIAILIFLSPLLGAALLPLALWACRRVPLYLLLGTLGVLGLAGWILRLPLPTLALEALPGKLGLRLLVGTLPLGALALLAGLPRIGRRVLLRRDERVHFLLLALAPTLALLPLGDSALALSAGLYGLLAVTLVLGEGKESWPDAAALALMLGNVALLVWPLRSDQIAAGWPSLTGIRRESRHWEAIRDVVLEKASPGTTLILTLPAEEGAVRRVLPGYRTLALSQREKTYPTGGAKTFLIVGRQLQTRRGPLGLELTDRVSRRARSLTAFVPVEAGELPGTSGDVYWLQAEGAGHLFIGSELRLTR